MKKLILLLALILLLPASAMGFEVTNDARLEYNKGIDFYKLGEYQKAMQCFRGAIDLSPDYIDAYYNLGTILEYLEQYEAALAVFKQIIIRCPDDYESTYKAAMLCVKLGYNSQARTYLSAIPRNSLQYESAYYMLSKIKNSGDNVVSQRPSTPSVEQTSVMYEDLAGPTGVAVDSVGNLYVATFSDGSITKILPNGARTIFVKDNRINGPISIVMDSYGTMYLANYNADNILKITRTGQISVLLANIKKPYGLCLSGNFLFISSQGSNSVLRYKLPNT